MTHINGKPAAKIMFFNGLSRTAKNGDITYLQNPNKEDNLAFCLQMQLAAAKQYPGFTRKIYLKGYPFSTVHTMSPLADGVARTFKSVLADIPPLGLNKEAEIQPW